MSNTNTINIGNGNTIGDINVNAGSGIVNTGTFEGDLVYTLGNDGSIIDFMQEWFGTTEQTETVEEVLDTETNPKLFDVQTSAWSEQIKVNKVVQASITGDTIVAEAPEKFVPNEGSILNGGQSNDTINGKIGWDIIEGGEGSDFVHGGNGRDVITGGAGEDELWGDFGLNTYKSEKDGYKDLLVIKSDHYVYNWLNNSYTNNPNGERTDFVEGLDSFDKIRITGAYTSELRFEANVTHGGQTGIAIYAKESLEVLYTGNDLSVDQLMSMTDGDGSVAATLNEIHQYGLGWW